jgi:hypothetical protein
MKFKVRHQISDLEEEIYCFEANEYGIYYRGFYQSKRKDINDPFGYDWEVYYKDAKQSELDLLEKTFGEDIYVWDHPEHDRYLEINDRYNPTVHGLLSGVYSSKVSKEHPLKISKETVIDSLIEKIKKMGIR